MKKPHHFPNSNTAGQASADPSLQAEEAPKPTPKREWHQLFGDLLDALLGPLGLCVEVDRKVQNESPRVDVLIRCEEGETWTVDQRAMLCDGIRDVKAAHILIEFKFSENLNERNLFQAVMYFFLYTKVRTLADDAVCAFLVCSQTPHQSGLRRFGFQPTNQPGVYRSQSPLVERVTLITLNDLADTPHNAAFKIFASRQAEVKKAFKTLKRYSDRFNESFQRLALVVYHFWYNVKGGIGKMREFTFEGFEKIGRLADMPFGRSVLLQQPVKDRMEGLSSEDRVEGLSPEDRLEGLSLEDRLTGFSKEEIRAYLSRSGADEENRD